MCARAVRVAQRLSSRGRKTQCLLNVALVTAWPLIESCRAGARAGLEGERVEQHRLARARGADDGEHLARRDARALMPSSRILRGTLAEWAVLRVRREAYEMSLIETVSVASSAAVGRRRPRPIAALIGFARPPPGRRRRLPTGDRRRRRRQLADALRERFLAASAGRGRLGQPRGLALADEAAEVGEAEEGAEAEHGAEADERTLVPESKISKRTPSESRMSAPL